MFRPLLCAALTSAFLLMPIALSAADENGQFAVDGVGGRSCSDYNAMRATEDGQRAFAGWTEGFVSAYNALSQDTFDVTPWQPVQLLLLKMGSFCKANPQVPYVNGLSALIRTLEPARTQIEDTFITIRNGDKGVNLYRRTLEKLRGDLGAAGFDAGDTDAALVQALSDYQDSKGLTQTGLPDAPTMNALYP